MNHLKNYFPAVLRYQQLDTNFISAIVAAHSVQHIVSQLEVWVSPRSLRVHPLTINFYHLVIG